MSRENTKRKRKRETGEKAELSTGRMDPRVGSGFCRVGLGHDFTGIWRVGSALRIFSVFFLIISWCLYRYESSNTTFGLIDFL